MPHKHMHDASPRYVSWSPGTVKYLKCTRLICFFQKKKRKSWYVNEGVKQSSGGSAAPPVAPSCSSSRAAAVSAARECGCGSVVRDLGPAPQQGELSLLTTKRDSKRKAAKGQRAAWGGGERGWRSRNRLSQHVQCQQTTHICLAVCPRMRCALATPRNAFETDFGGRVCWQPTQPKIQGLREPLASTRRPEVAAMPPAPSRHTGQNDRPDQETLLYRPVNRCKDISGHIRTY